ncbi:MAG: tRNA modification GTPase MnmE [Mycoplasmataceae bacterium]|nr:MAG: tRNA modification GTPase MnmE [Mycoplasmataceae bacterium]
MKYIREQTKTIVAVVTAPITQNIAIIRISGPKTYEIIKNIFNKKIPEKQTNKNNIILGKIIENKEVIDQVLLFCFYSPNSFTGEDTIEISCHGNLIIVNKILGLVLENGAELATPGEFSKQGFFNGKINLIQANAINDLIRAPNLSTANLAIQNFDYKKSEELEKLEDKLLEAIAKIEINIDYPEYEDVEKITIKKLIKILDNLINNIREIRIKGKKVKIYKEGIKIGIFGKPNVGKSTLLNALLNEEKAIVSSIAGTTRDVIESEYILKGIPLILFDTAGIRKTKNEIEKKGIEKSKDIYNKSDISFLVLDNSKKWKKEDEEILNIIKNKKYIIVINKKDLEKKLIIPKHIEKKNVVEISAEKKEIKNLEEKIIEVFSSNILVENSSHYPFLSHSWQQSKLKAIEKNLKEVKSELKKEIPVDIIAGELQKSFHLLRELSGNDYDEDLLDIIFSKFCLGK